MRMQAQRVLVAFLVFWLPFCCCQARVAAHALVHLSHAEDAECCGSGHDEPSCCDSSESDDHGDCCGGSQERDGQERTKGSCCVACKERALPPSGPNAIDEVSASTVDFVATALLADATTSCTEGRAPSGTQRERGPPPRPCGRQALRFHSVLVI